MNSEIRKMRYKVSAKYFYDKYNDVTNGYQHARSKKSFIKKLFLVTSFDKASGLENEFLECLQCNQTNYVES